MKMPYPARISQLTEIQEEMALEMAISSHSITEIAMKLNFGKNPAAARMAFITYRKNHPFFNEAFENARYARCEFLEDEVYSVAKDFEDAKAARVQLEALKALLAWANPKKYGPKVDLNVTHTIDLGAALQASNQRLNAVIDVTPVIANDIKDL